MNALRSMKIQNTAACQKNLNVRIFLLAELRSKSVIRRSNGRRCVSVLRATGLFRKQVEWLTRR
jgi:hypothetical protein